MNSANLKKKKISEYQIDDIKKFFSDILKKISSKVILIEIGSDFLNIGLAKSQNNNLYIKKILGKDAEDFLEFLRLKERFNKQMQQENLLEEFMKFQSRNQPVEAAKGGLAKILEV